MFRVPDGGYTEDSYRSVIHCFDSTKDDITIVEPHLKLPMDIVRLKRCGCGLKDHNIAFPYYVFNEFAEGFNPLNTKLCTEKYEILSKESNELMILFATHFLLPSDSSSASPTPVGTATLFMFAPTYSTCGGLIADLKLDHEPLRLHLPLLERVQGVVQIETILSVLVPSSSELSSTDMNKDNMYFIIGNLSCFTIPSPFISNMSSQLLASYFFLAEITIKLFSLLVSALMTADEVSFMCLVMLIFTLKEAVEHAVSLLPLSQTKIESMSPIITLHNDDVTVEFCC
ncbi:hypothetical protein KVT40_009253 [Elsinoe batatas]|uniref:Uncharacterized protein n=1 Tax=Elsinoe batatas TaxID=2601811 RepID=A0A8K0PB24_9PEZI|nr:hypothetical protein KVT40_009253 [Elsinoe batatas]